MMKMRTTAVLLGAICTILPIAWAFGMRSSSDSRTVALPDLGGDGATSSDAARSIGDLSTACGQVTGGGALAIAIRMTFSDVEVDQGVMQTADAERGFFVEFQRSERHVLRLGVNTRDGFRRVLVARQTWTGTRDAFVVLKGDGEISVTSGSAIIDVAGPEIVLDCSNWNVGAGNELQDFLGTVNMAWKFSPENAAFDRMVRNYRRELAAAGADSPRWPFVVAVLASVLMLAAVRSLSRAATPTMDGDSSDG
jgi:hypothetical protein